MASNAKDGAFGDLSTEEVRMLDAAVKKCAASADSLIQEIGVVYLRGMCDMLRVQGRLSQEAASMLLHCAKGR